MKDLHSISNSWCTPDWLFKDLNTEFTFDIDLCATKENSKCGMYGTDYFRGWVSHIDGHKCIELAELYNTKLVQTAFMNPPYSNPLPFIEKAWKDSRYCKIVCLVKCDTSTKWWAVFWDYAKHAPKPGCEVRFFPARIKFDPPKGFCGKVSSPSFPSALIIMDRRNI